MELADIIRLAGVKSGVISTFNPDEIPSDFEGMGRELFMRDVLVGINCDRNLDVTDTALTMTPTDGKIVLKSITPGSRIIVLGDSQYSSAELEEGAATERHTFPPLAIQLFALTAFGITAEGDFPSDDVGDPLRCGVWTADGKFFMWSKFPNENDLGELTDYNIKFTPMRVQTVYENSDRRLYEYVYRDEFEGPDFHNRTDIYTTEEYEDRLVIMFNTKTDTPKRIVIPVPITVTRNRFQTGVGEGTIHAPAKFEKYLSEQLAVEMAVLYGMSTAEKLSLVAQQGYARLVKAGRKFHGQNIGMKISHYLGRRTPDDFV